MSETISRSLAKRKRPTMDSKYLITVQNVETGEYVANAYGSFGVMNFAAKDALKSIKDASDDFAARVVEVEAIGTEDEKRSVVSVQGDWETVTVVLKKKLARERKEQNPEDAPAEDAPAEDAPAV
jgi:hypothetical protein